jgi:hypothetical protein
VSSLDEAHPGEFPHLASIQAGLEVEVELLQGLDPREASQPEAGLDPALEPPLPFGFQGLGQEALVVQFPLGGLLADGLQLGIQVVQLQLLQQRGQLHRDASS